MEESVYPFTSSKGDVIADHCLYDKTLKHGTFAKSYQVVQYDSVSQMKAAIAKQPISVFVDADQMVFQTYSSGILDSDDCGIDIDHVVLAVGYGEEDGKQYWLVKNSWNTTWGDQGYIKLAIKEGNGVCGVQMGPSYPIASQN